MQELPDVKDVDVRSPTVVQKDILAVPQSTDKKPLIDNDQANEIQEVSFQNSDQREVKVQEPELLKNESSIREILEKYDNEQINESLSELRGTANFNAAGNGPKLPPREQAQINQPEEKPMGCMQKLGRTLGMTSDIDPKKIYQIELKIRNLENDLDTETTQRKQLEQEVERLKLQIHSKGNRVSLGDTMMKIPVPSLENRLASDNQVDFSQRVQQQDQNLLHMDDIFMMEKEQPGESPLTHILPTDQDATNRNAALRGNLSFDQRQDTHSTGRSTGNQEVQQVKMAPSFNFARQQSNMDVTKRAPAKPQMISAGEKIIVTDVELTGVEVIQTQEEVSAAI